MLARSVAKSVTGKRFFSAVSPKVAIAQNILLMKEIANAADDAALIKLSAAGLPKVDTASPPSELEEFKEYFALSKMSSTETFTRDPKAWQNMGFADYAGTEVQRAETWPFLVGFV